MSTDQSELYKHLEVVEYVGDMVGAEKAADQLRVNLVDSEGNPEVDVSDRDGRVLGTVSVDELPEPVTTQLAAALSSNGNDAVRVASPSPLDVSAATVPTEQQTPVALEDTNDTQVDPATDTTLTDTLSREIATWSAGTLATEQQTPVKLEDSSGTNIDPATDTTLTDTLSREIATWSAGTLSVQEDTALDVSATTVPTEQQTPVGIEDTSDTQIDPAQSISYPAVSEQQDLIASGDLVVGPVAVDRATALVVSASSADGNAWSCSVEWQNADGNTVYTESATDINMDSVTEDYSRLARKGSAVVVTFTDESGASANTINVHANTHK